MTIDRISSLPLRIPLRIRFSQSNQNTLLSDSLIVMIHTDDQVVGYGECCPRPYVTGETVQSVCQELGQLALQLAGKSWTQFSDLLEWLEGPEPDAYGPATICGLEMALLDAWAKTGKNSLATLLDSSLGTDLSYSGVIPMSSRKSLEPLLARFWFGSLKVKVGKDLAWNLDRIQWLKGLYGQTADIRADVNGGWTREEALEQIPHLLKLGITSFEQPLHPKLDEEMPALTAEFRHEARFVADESLTTIRSAERLMSARAFSDINIKLSKHGGLLRSLRISSMARENGLSCQLGAHFGETSLLTAAGIHFSGLVPDLRYREGALGTWLLQEDLCDPSIRIDELGLIRKPMSVFHENGWGLRVRLPETAFSSTRMT